LVSDAQLDRLAAALHEAQVNRIAAGILRVRAHHPALARAVVTGLGDFLAARAARAWRSRTSPTSSVPPPATRRPPPSPCCSRHDERPDRPHRGEGGRRTAGPG